MSSTQSRSASLHLRSVSPPTNPQSVAHPLAHRIIFGTYIRMSDDPDEILDENLEDGSDHEGEHDAHDRFSEENFEEETY